MSSFISKKTGTPNAGPINIRKADQSITTYTSGTGRIYEAIDPKSGKNVKQHNKELLRLAAQEGGLDYDESRFQSKDGPVKWLNAIEKVFETKVISCDNGKQYKWETNTNKSLN